MDSRCSLPLPDAYLDFLKENGIDPAIYGISDSIPRYIRIKPGSEDQVQELEDEIKCKLEKVVWLPGFFSIPPSVQIANLKAYQDGKIYGMDAASGAAVWALNVSAGDHVLDLCAAPGAKLCMLLDLLGSSGSVTGVDVARHRLAACRTMVQKYALGDHCRLFVADGTTFSLLPLGTQWDAESGASETEEKMNAFKEWMSRRPWKERKRASKARNNNASELVPGAQEPEMIFYGRCSGVVGLTKNEAYKNSRDNEALRFGYDKVLVDAECTHDGSIRHIQKFEYWGWKTLQRRVLDAQRTDTLTHLQLQLLTNGFRLLKAGGSLVYSTCSLTTAQNEDVVEKFLSQNAFAAELQEIDAAQNWPCRSGRIPNTLRFDPSTSQTSGLFVAKFKKIVS
ncbi:rRNA (cytosine-C(5))-methyltransferase NOP2C isoform X1 [Telopea speciosissima]|uniref:rRNA (cytosine-C(5))-methyltransferase NOP2C isoform X1 n=1 Tax=Telopea speciosissima TaxID=54955 RepID=UPI001CC4E416|nr:rRNA (cytosine-C(5))-methyltransferase NOP2C isoform X1 [Telopea speciosissima]XP_043690070.1 rRNA (cytosine-C(5))-methyltransferase NOP2C isoform X1 [Telopea speciosissima]